MRKKKAVFATGAYAVFWAIQMACKSYVFLDGDRIYLALSLLSLAFLGVKYLLTDWSFRDCLWASVVLFAGMMVYVLTRMPAIFVLALAVVGAKDVDLRKLLSWTLVLRTVVFTIVVTAVIFGKLPDGSVELREMKDLFNFLFTGSFTASLHRYYFGYGYANIAHIQLFILVCLYSYVKDNKLAVWEYVGIALVNLILYHWTGSRTSMWLVFLFEACSFVIRCDWGKRILRKAGPWVPLGVLVGCILLSIVWQKDRWDLWGVICYRLNDLFSGRLEYQHYAIRSFVAPLLGDSFSNGWNQLDCAHLNLWLRFGLLTSALFYGGTTLFLSKCAKEERDAEILIFALFAFLGLMEMSYYAVTMNVFLVLLSEVLFPKREKEFPARKYLLLELVQRDETDGIEKE
ncbi:MAG: hypothetical protein ACI4U2_00920 [Christensenellaceae bacterium]